jgi:putative acetyltransferase
MKIRLSTADDFGTLLDVWLRSVRATHVFLTDADIQSLLPVVRDQALPNLELWVLCNDNGVPIGFVGVSEGTIDALFIAPEHRRRGGGRLLVEHARKLKGILRVDVNEQNPQAVLFYMTQGFRVIGRSPVDDAGRTFPILYMQQENTGGFTPTQ